MKYNRTLLVLILLGMGAVVWLVLHHNPDGPPPAASATTPTACVALPASDPSAALRAWLADERPESRTAHELTRGIALAGERREWLLGLIESDPEAALKASLSAEELAALPPEIAALSERRIDQPAFYGVLAICNHDPGNPHGQACRIEREVRLGGLADPDRYTVHTFGTGLDRKTEENGLVTGIAIDGHMAVAPPSHKEPSP